MQVSSDFVRKGIKPEYEQWHNKELLKNEDFTNNPVLYFGISWDEAHREKDIRKNWQPYEVEMPLMEEVIDNNEILLSYISSIGVCLFECINIGNPSLSAPS